MFQDLDRCRILAVEGDLRYLMRTPCTHYSLYQRFFNTCLREWYFQRDGGAGFYYANPPGLLFTPLRTSRLQKDTFSAPMSHWYFKLPLDGDRFNRTSPLKSDVFGSSSVLQEPNAVESILHIGYDLWYSKVLGAHVSKYTDVYHVSFCNYYDVAFNTLYNVGRNLSVSPEDFDTFQNFRLLTGNIFNMHSILTEPFFKCVILSVSIQNMKHLLHWRTLTSISNVLTTNGSVVLLAKETEVLRQLRKAFKSPLVAKLFTQSDERTTSTGPYTCHSGTLESGQVGCLISDISTRDFVENVQKSETEALTKSVRIVAYNKRISTLPNQGLRKPVNTL